MVAIYKRDIDIPLHWIAYDYSCADCYGLCDHLRDVSWEDIFKFSASAATSEFCEWVQVGVDVYIHDLKYQVKRYLSPWFSAACPTTIAPRNRLYQQNKSSESKVKLRQANSRCKRLLEAAKITYVIKTIESITSQKLNFPDFWQIASSVLSKGKSLYILYSTARRCCLLLLIKQNCLRKSFLRALFLDDSGISLPVFPYRTN